MSHWIHNFPLIHIGLMICGIGCEFTIKNQFIFALFSYKLWLICPRSVRSSWFSCFFLVRLFLFSFIQPLKLVANMKSPRSLSGFLVFFLYFFHFHVEWEGVKHTEMKYSNMLKALWSMSFLFFNSKWIKIHGFLSTFVLLQHEHDTLNKIWLKIKGMRKKCVSHRFMHVNQIVPK